MKFKILAIISISLLSSLFINQAFALPFDNEWQLREQERSSGATPITECTYTVNPTSLRIDTNSPTVFDQVGWCHIFKVFNKSDLIGKTATITWSGGGTATPEVYSFRVLDGAFDRTNSTQFPVDNFSINFGFTGLSLNQLHSVKHFAPFSTTTDSIIMTMAGSTQNQVTIAVSSIDAGAVPDNSLMDIEEIKIDGVALWDWNTNASVTLEVTGTNNDEARTNAILSSLDVTPPVITTTISEPIPIKSTEEPFPLILKNVTGGGSTTGLLDDTASKNEILHSFTNVVIPNGAKVHTITIRNTGASTETKMGWYNDGINLSQDLGFEVTQSNDFANPEEIQWKLVPPQIKVAGDTQKFGFFSNQTTAWLAIGGSEVKLDSNAFFAVLPNSLSVLGDVAQPAKKLNQTITFQEVENFGAFDPLEFVTCIDDIDGVITNKVTSVGTVDTSVPKGYAITYTCTDRASNQSQLEVQYIIKRQPTSGISVSTIQQPVGGVQEVPSLSDIPSLAPTEPTQPPTRTLDEIFDLFSLLFEEVEPTPTLEVVPESVTEIPPPLSQPTVEPTEVRPSFIESIQNFFAGLFG